MNYRVFIIVTIILIIAFTVLNIFLNHFAPPTVLVGAGIIEALLLLGFYWKFGRSVKHRK
jgi:hypothetical protein